MNLSMFIFVTAFCSFIYFSLEIWKVLRGPEIKADMERLREQRRLRQSARRRR